MQPATTPDTQPLEAGDLLNEQEAAAILNCQVSTLRSWRWKGSGPVFHKIGNRLVRYSRADLMAFVQNGGAK